MIIINPKYRFKVHIVQPPNLFRFATTAVMLQRIADRRPAVTRHLLKLGYTAMK